MADNALRQKSFPGCGRLIVLQSQGNKPLFDNNSDQNFVGFTAINFPAMPDLIDLTRHADYLVTTNPAFPDGIHQYRGTSILEIPVNFRLHAFDKEYCPNGVLTVLQVAASLQALVAPFGPEDIQITVGPAAQTAQGTPERTDVAKLKGASTDSTLGGTVDTKDIYPPATCYLELILTERSLPGIACVGYVKDVSTKFGGPWMRGPGISQNLPTTCEFSFTFVHHPGHGNAFNVGTSVDVSERQAFAQTIERRLFNTRDLLVQSNFRGFNDSPNGT